ncbi:hypothetical protein SEA_SUPERCALLIE99_61 [Mycobacterium phage SuperCallie99]|uniref:Uncharacterized protein n=5 Tax=Gladiatorvirus TaxID=2948726 RepID=A0A7G9A1C6_9CAUD|nr:hypothetical protein SEA_SUPERCALLIE99_61 [Mycobacterium phage SuperCallie99]
MGASMKGLITVTGLYVGLLIGSYGLLSWACLVMEKGEEAAHGAAEDDAATRLR